MKLRCSKNQQSLIVENVRFAKRFISNNLPPVLLEQLRELTRNFSLSLKCGDLLLLSGGWYVTHAGLIRLAKRCRCSGMEVQPARQLSDHATNRYAFRATVYKSARCRGFVGYGDADPSNVSPLVHGAEMRVAETRAVNRALRKAYGIGICSVEEIGSFAEPPQTNREPKKVPPQPADGNHGGPKVRDRLCQIIRQHQLDPGLVKAYATDLCGVKTLRDATRGQIENFVKLLANRAEEDREALLCQLNSYPLQKEGAA
ncbi:MAG: hypothetical protein JWQ87_4651 [Candidatus Sulfotelmatobacter sp.]|nr:hypothetical protein [Candidatus Sulfotelmatobacter sp.]